MHIFVLEILSIDRHKSQTQIYHLPDVDFNDTAMLASIWLTMSLILIFFGRIIYFLFKWRTAGTDEENLVAAKANIKKSLLLFFLSSISWITLSAIYQGIQIQY